MRGSLTSTFLTAARSRARAIGLTGWPGALLPRARDDTLGLRIAQVCQDQAPDLWAGRRTARYDPRDTSSVDSLLRDLADRLGYVLPVHYVLLEDWYLDADRTLAPARPAERDDGHGDDDEWPPPYHHFLPVLYHGPYELDVYDDDVGVGEAMLALAMLGGFPREADAIARSLEGDPAGAGLAAQARDLARALGDEEQARRLYDDAAGAFAGAPAPFDTVPAFLRHITASTGNAWLDRLEHEYPEYEEVAWTVDAMRAARAGCAAASTYITALRPLRARIATPEGFCTLLDLIARTLEHTEHTEHTGESAMTTDLTETTRPATIEIDEPTRPTTEGTAQLASPQTVAGATTGAAEHAAIAVPGEDGDDTEGVLDGNRPEPDGPRALPERRPGYIQVEECVARAFGLHTLLGLAEVPVVDLSPGEDGEDGEDGGAVEVTLSLSRRWGFAVKTLHDERGLPYLHSMIAAGDIASALGRLSRRPALREEGTFLDMPAADNNGMGIKGVYVPGRRIAPLKQVGSKNIRFDEAPIPNHIIVAVSYGRRRTFYMWAVLRYPSSPRDAICAMPVNNVMDRSGWVCVGDVALPQAGQVAARAAEENLNLGEIDRRLLDDSRYTNAYSDNKSKKYPRNLDDLWRWLATLPRDHGYPYDDLVQVGTVEDILSGALCRAGML